MVNVAITGATGNMGQEVMNFVCALPEVKKVSFLCVESDLKRGKLLQKKHSKSALVLGSTTDPKACAALVADADYVIHMAAMIPPSSDRSPSLADKVNFDGTKNLVDVVCALPRQPKFIHFSTVALYGNRNHIHPFGRVGDPLLPSPYDNYALAKLESERYVLESPLRQWAVIRQTAMLHNRMLTDNLGDGLMFHTCYNAPLEWVTARDSGRLVGNILAKDIVGSVSQFWLKVYNLGGGAKNRITGFEVFDGGFKIIGGSAEKFLRPNTNATRNFHGMWFSDSDVLQNMFDFQRDTVADFWQEIAQNHKLYKIAKILPAWLISALAIKPLQKSPNSPAYWAKHGDEGRIIAYFGGFLQYNKLPKNWKDFPLLCKGQLPDGKSLDYTNLRTPSPTKMLQHGYDETKPDAELTLSDMAAAAKFRGGDVVSKQFKQGNLHQKLIWRCQHGHEFQLSPFTVLKAGHWCPECNRRYVWNYDNLAQGNPFYAQVWWDSHSPDEKVTYFFDEEYNAKFQIQNDKIKTEENK